MKNTKNPQQISHCQNKIKQYSSLMTIPPELIAFAIRFIRVMMQLLYWAIMIDILLSWFAGSRTKFGLYLHQITQRLYAPFQWARLGGLGFAPIFALLVIQYGGLWLIRQLSAML